MDQTLATLLVEGPRRGSFTSPSFSFLICKSGGYATYRVPERQEPQVKREGSQSQHTGVTTPGARAEEDEEEGPASATATLPGSAAVLRRGHQWHLACDTEATPSTDEKKERVVCAYKGTLLVHKENETSPFAATRMDRERITMSEVRQRETSMTPPL